MSLDSIEHRQFAESDMPLYLTYTIVRDVGTDCIVSTRECSADAWARHRVSPCRSHPTCEHRLPSPFTVDKQRCFDVIARWTASWRPTTKCDASRTRLPYIAWSGCYPVGSCLFCTYRASRTAGQTYDPTYPRMWGMASLAPP